MDRDTNSLLVRMATSGVVGLIASLFLIYLVRHGVSPISVGVMMWCGGLIWGIVLTFWTVSDGERL